jgi:uncharacterized repeat protein (TIGR03803 family)
MKSRLSSMPLAALSAILLLSLPLAANAQTLTILHHFGAAASDGENPEASLTAVGSTLYGATAIGGTNNNGGTVFAINTDGSGYTILHDFGESTELGYLTYDGITPDSPILVGTTLYGTTSRGGTFIGANGTVFAMDTDGSGYTILHSCNSTVSDGANPNSLILVGSNTLYGTSDSGGTNGKGTVFAMDLDGSDYTILHSFGGAANDGIDPAASLTLVGSTLYGTTKSGGANGKGMIFSINLDGSGYTILHEFGAIPNDGSLASARLILVGSNTLYGTTTLGGTLGPGTAFAMNLDGSGYTILHSFGAVAMHDGWQPSALTLVGSTLYGTTQIGSLYGGGTVFAMNLDGSGYTNLYQFGATANDGKHPQASLTLVGSTLYGTTAEGGAYGAGTVFALELPTSPLSGLLQVFLEPGAAAADGAQWQVDDGVLQNSGATVSSVSVGSHPVTFTTITGWTTPANQTVTISAGQTMTVTGTYVSATGGGCTFTLSKTSVILAAKGGSKNVSLKGNGTDCSWTAVSNDPFITITSGSSGTGKGKVDYTVPGNTNTTALSGTMTIAGQTFTVNQATGGCTFKLSPTDEKFKAAGGLATVKVKPNLNDCEWTAVSNDSFITITGGTNGVGSGGVSYMVTPNTATTVVTGTMTIAGETYTVTQAGAK